MPLRGNPLFRIILLLALVSCLFPLLATAQGSIIDNSLSHSLDSLGVGSPNSGTDQEDVPLPLGGRHRRRLHLRSDYQPVGLQLGGEGARGPLGCFFMVPLLF